MEQRHPRLNPRRNGWVESLEKRIVMSTDMLGAFLGGGIDHHVLSDDPLAAPSESELDNTPDYAGRLAQHLEDTPDFCLGSARGDIVDPTSGDLEMTLVSAHDQTGLLDVSNNYGFLGMGQTVVIIDSGIAYDHIALGNGFGTDYRVVGGWDFTGENDADPYDDGPSGSHGTHVAGIIGADSGSPNSSGVAPGVDLIGLRVFDDNGDGYFSWVENALQWVHTHRNDYENPITAVNLSLGAEWNSDTLPSWAMLEDEFAQLETDGIFIAVSAGNSFTTYEEPGLSYPAASSYVVPVMATNDSGALSYFSQRHDLAIAAPGQWITSTVPDYAGNQNGIADDWASYSGTSMAAPYIAGASVLIREAMEFVGNTEITQDMIYDHMRGTADTFYDSATDQDYHRLALNAAIDAIMPADDYGSTIETAYGLGTVNEDQSLSGLIGTLNDQDYFTFTAGIHGTVTFETTATTHNLTPDWQLDGGGGSVRGDHSEQFTFDVVAGQTYTVGLGTGAGIGYYDLSISAEVTFNPIDWGIISFDEQLGLTNSGEAWYQIELSRTGILTAEAFFQNVDGDIDLEFYDGQLQLLDSSTTTEDWERVDLFAYAGETFYLRVTGSNSEIDFRLTNLIAFDGAALWIHGTDGADSFTFEAGASQIVTVNGVMYDFDFGNITSFHFDGSSGIDTITLTGTAGDETAMFAVGQIELTGNGYAAVGIGIEHIMVDGGGGHDIAQLYDSAGDDIFTSSPTVARMEGNGFEHAANNFEKVYAYSTLGTDSAQFYDSAGDDLYRAWDTQAVMKGDGYYNLVSQFAQTYAYSSSGTDIATFYDSAGDDLYRAWDAQAVMKGDGYYNLVSQFAQTYAYSSSGTDIAKFYDSAGDDLYRAWDTQAVMKGDGYYNLVSQFAQTYAYASSGTDIAIFYDSAGDDLYRAWDAQAIMRGQGYYNLAAEFAQTYAYASTGNDEAILYDSTNDDLYRAWHDQVVMKGQGYYNLAAGFGHTYAYASTGNDEACFYDSAGDDLYRAWHYQAVMKGQGYYNLGSGFAQTFAYSSTGDDEARFYDSAGSDLYQAWQDSAVMSGAGFYNFAGNFNRFCGYSSTQDDRAILYDSTVDDLVKAQAWGAFMLGGGSYRMASGFHEIEAQGIHGGNNTSVVEAIDYLFSLVGDWN